MLPTTYYWLACLVIFISGSTGRQSDAGSMVDKYSYLDNDFPREWDIDPLEPVDMVIDDTRHYGLNGDFASQHWGALIPGGDGVIQLGPEGGRNFTFSMVHQLQCLDIIRIAVKDNIPYTAETDTYGQIRHCMNYLRQMVLCRSDIYLENVRRASNSKPGNVPIRSMRKCLDWRRVYDEVEMNKKVRGI